MAVLCRLIIGAIFLLTLLSPPPLTAGDTWTVPQLDATVLEPLHVEYHPKFKNLVLIVNRSGRIEVLDVANPNSPLKQLEFPAGASSASFHPMMPNIVSGGIDGTVRLWDLTGKQVAQLFEGHAGRVRSVAFNHDGTRIVSGGDDGTVRLWDLTGNQVAQPFEGHEGWVLSVAFNHDGTRVISGGEDGTVRLWDLTGTQVAQPFEGHGAPVMSVAFNHDGTRIVSGGEDGTVRLWDLTGKQVAQPFEGHAGRVMSVAFNHDGTRIASGGDDGTVRLWDLTGTQVAQPFEGHRDLVRSVAFNHDGTRLVSGGDDETARLWEMAGKQVAQAFEGHGDPVTSVAFNLDGTRITSGGNDGTVRLWDLTGKQVAQPFEGHGNPVTSVDFNHDGMRLVSGGDDGTVRLWDLTGKQVTQPFEGHGGRVLSVAFNHDGTRIVSGGSGGTVRLWDLTGKQVAQPFEGHGDWVRSVAFNHDGTRIVSGGDDGTVRLWDLTGKQVAQPFEGHEGWVLSVAFNHDGTRIVSGGSDGTVRLWDLTGKQVVQPFEGHGGWVRSVAFNHDGTRIVSGGEDGTVRLWDTHGKQLSFFYVCPAHVAFLTNLNQPATRITAQCKDRVVFLDGQLNMLAQMFLIPGDGLTLITGEGVSWYRGAPLRKFNTYEFIEREETDPNRDNVSVFQRPLASNVKAERLRQVLLDDWSPWQRSLDKLLTIRNQVTTNYDEHVYGWRVWVFWPFLLWICTVLSAGLLWLFVPAKFCHWMLPSPNAPELPPLHKKFGTMISLYGWLSRTRRPTNAWFHRHRAQLEDSVFIGRRPVKERRRYAEVSLDRPWAPFPARPKRSERMLGWVHGTGGSGKTAFACDYAFRYLVGSPKAPLPVFVDEDWTGELADHVASVLRLHSWDRGLTPNLVKRLGARGLICPIVDSLSERSNDDALTKVETAASESHFRHLIVTSRLAPPSTQFWEQAHVTETRPLSSEDVPKFIDKYVDDEKQRPLVSNRIAVLVDQEPMPSPLFLRFAIEQACYEDLKSPTRIGLVLKYADAARAGKVDIAKEDFNRAAGLAAVEAVRGEDHLPREFTHDFLRGVLQRAADEQVFMNEQKTEEVTPAKLIDFLETCGILSRNLVNSRLQFTYDPVAEYLAAWYVAEQEEKNGVVSQQGFEDLPESAVAKAIVEIRKQLQLSAASHA
ncbi:hypothetical protein KUW17_18850 [Leisingera aquaemixtae]|uniref:WD40 repeat domain-containing protein n=1 Tax=Leisingera aquaemixtae TaxID=1396826 RepID=UPI001C952485|nr:WD40 repeat domain-containing protein [Leisingera aquaemixtae]MBY6068809.1 hypothetical protein [Leisingera aquaemixtae]